MLPGNGSILKKSPFRPETGEKERVPAFAGTLQEKEERRSNSPRCGADVALSLVRVHCKEVREEKLKSFLAPKDRVSSDEDAGGEE